MAERKNLTITQVKEIEKVGTNQIPKLPFRAKDGNVELECFTFRPRLFESIKEGQTINADVETSIYLDRTQYKITQIYTDGQPLVSKGAGYRGKSPEELELSAKSYALSYSKDLAVAQVIPLKDITKQADVFYNWLKGNEGKPVPLAKKPKPEVLTKEQDIDFPQDTPAPELGFIDGQWFREKLAMIQNNKGDTWANDKLLNYITKSYRVKGDTLEQAVANLGRESAAHFTNKMEVALASIEE